MCRCSFPPQLLVSWWMLHLELVFDLFESVQVTHNLDLVELALGVLRTGSDSPVASFYSISLTLHWVLTGFICLF